MTRDGIEVAEAIPIVDWSARTAKRLRPRASLLTLR